MTVRFQRAWILHRFRAQLGAVEGPFVDALQLAAILEAERAEVPTAGEGAPSNVRDALRNDDATNTSTIEAAVLDALQARAGLEDDLAKLSAVREGKLPDCLDAAGDNNFADIASLEPAVPNDFEAVREANCVFLTDAELLRRLRRVL